MTSKRPVRKVATAGASGAAATIVLWLVELSGVTVPTPVAAAITTVVAAGIGYLTPSAPGEPRPASPDHPV